ncbi:phosphotransferase [Colletotrichum higginsianum]|nr:phosphotransferase [Colletotrichum higginsianum]
MAPYDFIAQQDIRDARLAFARSLVEAKDDIVAFVDERLGWNRTARYNGFLKGSFNISLIVKRHDSEEHVVIRFPVPGNIHKPWRDEKV